MLRSLTVSLLSLLLMCTGCGQSEQARTPDEEPEPTPSSTETAHRQADIGTWLTYYYLDPEPERIPWFMQQLAAEGVLQHESAAAHMIGFLSHVMADNPERLSVWFPPDARIFSDERATYYKALWQSDVNEARAILDDVQERGPAELVERLVEMRQTPPRPILEWPVTSSGDLDVFWGSFFATGDVHYIVTIISVAQWSPSTYEDTITQSAAVWSLGSNARQHELVYRVCKEHVDDEDGQPSDDLKQIVEAASEYWP